MVTIGSQASGETGLKSCTSGLKAAFAVAESPQRMPSGTATSVASRKPKKTVRIDGAYVKKQLAEIVKDQDLSRYIL